MSLLRPRELSRQEFLACFQAPMSDVTSFQEPAADIWPYVELIDPGGIGLRAIHDVEHVWRADRHDHVLIGTDRADVFLAIVVDRTERQVMGHRLLDLPSEYGIEERKV